MNDVHAYVTGSDSLAARVASLDGVTVVDDRSAADCEVTDDHGAIDDAAGADDTVAIAAAETSGERTAAGSDLPVVVVAPDLDAVPRRVAGFVREDAPDAVLADQLRFVVTARPRSVGRSKAKRLHGIATEMVACDDPDEVYRLAVEAAERILDLDICYLGEAGETYFEHKAVSDGMESDGYGDMRVDEGIAGKTYQSGDSVLLDEVAPATEAEPADDAYRSAISAPVGDVGVFQAVSYEPAAFDENDRELVELLMSHVGETVNRLRTEARLRERNDIIERLHGIATEMIACGDGDALAALLVDAAERVLDFEVCVVLLRRDGGERADDDQSGGGPADDDQSGGGPADDAAEPTVDTLEIVAATDSPLAPTVGDPVPSDAGIVGQTYQSRESILVGDVADHGDAEPSAEQFRSALSVPLGDVGVVQAIATDPDVYDERDRELAELLVSQAAAALARIRAERELVAERDRLEEFAAVVSHDLRNPLAVADGALSIVRETGDEAFLDKADDALDRMRRIIDDVLSLARQPAVTDTEPVALDDVAGTAAENVGLPPTQLTTDATTVDADSDRLLRLLENLFRNSVEHGGDDVTVSVGPLDPATDATADSAGSSTTETGFFVADDGPGIPPDQRDTVFESGYTTAGSGTGFGLTIVETIATAHGWDVVATESDDGGARFEFLTDRESA